MTSLVPPLPQGPPRDRPCPGAGSRGRVDFCWKSLGGPGQLPTRGSHRSGRARLRQPARPAADWPALRYLAALREQHPRFRVLDLSPTAKAATRHLLRSAGSWRSSSPTPSADYEALRRPAAPLASLLVSLGDTIARVCLRLSASARRRPAARCFRGGQHLALECRAGNGRASQVPGGSSCAYAVFSDPGGTERARPLRRVGAAPASAYDEGSRDSVISGLNSTAWALAVYASPSPLRCRRRKTRFRLLAKLCRAGLATCKIPMKGFRRAPYMSSPFPKLPGANDVPLLPPLTFSP